MYIIVTGVCIVTSPAFHHPHTLCVEYQPNTMCNRPSPILKFKCSASVYGIYARPFHDRLIDSKRPDGPSICSCMAIWHTYLSPEHFVCWHTKTPPVNCIGVAGSCWMDHLWGWREKVGERGGERGSRERERQRECVYIVYVIDSYCVCSCL